MGRGRAEGSQTIIDAAVEILEEIQPATVRAVCYRLFTMKLVSGMDKGSTNRVSRLLTIAREEGAVPWEWIVDETREVEQAATWRDPQHRFEHAIRVYRKDYWRDQPNRVEVWSEKGTVRGTLAPVLDKYAVPFRVMHGYGSATAVNDIAEESRGDPRPYVALYVGDYDPSGMHMSEVDLPQRIERYEGDVDVYRVALIRSDLRGLPSFPLIDKMRDPRARWFRKHYGSTCWELDALSPPLLRAKVEVAIEGQLDRAAWAHSIKVEKVERESMRVYLKGWNATRRSK